MNTTDLRDELASRAEDLRADGPAISAAVAGRVRAMRRRRAVAGAGSGAILAVAVGVASWQGMAGGTASVNPATEPVPSVSLGSDGLPHRSMPDAPGDIVKDGLRFRRNVGADTLAAGAIGARGMRSLDVTWAPRTTHVSVAMDCWNPATDPAASKVEVRLLLDGERVAAQRCDGNVEVTGDLEPGGIIPGDPGAGWDALEVGRDATIRVEAVDRTTGLPVTPPQLRVAAAVYELGPQAEIRDARGTVVAALPKVMERDGYAYVLQDLVTGAPREIDAGLSIATPGGTPFLVTWGSAATGEPAEGRVGISGLAGEGTESGDGGWTTAPQPAREAGEATLTHTGPVPTVGAAFIAVYTLEK
jgi:hypothetical protein